MAICILIFCLVGCSYHFDQGETCRGHSSVCVPYVEGDKDGLFTAALIRAVTTSGCWVYGGSGGDLVLKVSLLPPEDLTIGYIFAPPDRDDHLFKNTIVSQEARLILAANVVLVERGTGKTLFGPLTVGRYLDYDYEPDLSNKDLNAFSLGQLEMHNLAQDAAFPALYTLLAEKIVDYVNKGW